jgi:hypothetical protein
LPVINLERRDRRTGWLLIRAAIDARAQSKAPLTEPRHRLPNGWPAPCRHAWSIYRRSLVGKLAPPLLRSKGIRNSGHSLRVK